MDARFEENEEDSDELIIDVGDSGWTALTAFRRDCNKKGENGKALILRGKLKIEEDNMKDQNQAKQIYEFHLKNTRNSSVAAQLTLATVNLQLINSLNRSAVSNKIADAAKNHKDS